MNGEYARRTYSIVTHANHDIFKKQFVGAEEYT